MTLQINFELSQADLDHFCQVLKLSRKSATDIPAEKIIENAKLLLKQVQQSDARDFVRQGINQLETLIGMLQHKTWHLADDDRERVLTALSYFSESADLIPDDIPGLGFLDDAIMIEIVCRELEHEIQAYKEFVKDYCAESDQVSQDPSTAKPSGWLEERRAQLHSRMRRRRKNQTAGKQAKSRFSLF